ncbi:MAG: flagellar hook-associated protein FlgK [Microthrixaceae bacterium]
MSSFGSLNTALSGLLSQRRVLDTIGHNIANSATEGFSRRRVELTPAGQWAVPSLYSRSTVSGNGVKVTGVTRVRDELLENRAMREHGSAQRLQTESSMLLRIEQMLPEPSDVGMSVQFGDFFAAWDDVANDPGNSAGRIALLQQGRSIASTFNRVSSDLTNLRNKSVKEVDQLVSQVNANAAQIADLNQSIAQATASGLDPHDLADRRDLLVKDLADLIGVSVTQGDLGTVNITLGGSSLVKGSRSEQLKVAESGPLGGDFAGVPMNTVEVQWAIDGYPATVTGGRVAGLLATANVHVPRTISDLDKVAATLVTTVNAAHQTGQGLDTAADVNLNYWDPAGVTAASIKLSSDVDGNPTRVAAGIAGSGALDATIAQQIAAMHQTSGSADSVYADMIGRLAIETQTMEQRSYLQTEVTNQADDARISVSGVNLDEELTAMITAQRSYEAASRMLTTIDQALDTLINRTGLVGR